MTAFADTRRRDNKMKQMTLEEIEMCIRDSVWLGNAQTLIDEGKAKIPTAICTLDDVMIYLIDKGLESELSFTIMESVRKGKGLKPEWDCLLYTSRCV